MITISSFTHRLGNQLFQIAAAYTLAKKHGVEFLCPEWKYQQYFKHKFKQYNGEPIEKYWSEDGFRYKEIPFTDNMAISGYFQSWKYFYKNQIREVFSFDSNSNIYPIYSDYCAVHIRRGDYLNYPNHHPLCPIEYYDKAMSESGFNKFMVFSDDIDWCKVNLSNSNYVLVFSENQSEIDDFNVMANCGANIIANSTFSWWAALLNKNAQIIISPHKDNWHGPAYAHWNHDDLIPDNWKQIKL